MIKQKRQEECTLKKLFEQTYGNHLSLGGAEEHFADHVCGQLDTNIAEEIGKIVKHTENWFECTWKLELGVSLKVEITVFEKEDSEEEEYEWYCVCYPLPILEELTTK